MSVDAVVRAARAARQNGASRFCMGAAWRGPRQRDLEKVATMVREVKALGLETCATLGMLKEGQAEQLKDAGLDFYNHNLDTDPALYGRNHYHARSGRPTRYFAESAARPVSGCAVAVSSAWARRVQIVPHSSPNWPTSILIRKVFRSTTWCRSRARRCMAHRNSITFEFIRTIAAARITMPQAMVRLSAGREEHVGGNAGVVLSGRCQFDLLRRKTSYHAKSRDRPRSNAVRQTWHQANGTPRRRRGHRLKEFRVSFGHRTANRSPQCAILFAELDDIERQGPVPAPSCARFPARLARPARWPGISVLLQ